MIYHLDGPSSHNTETDVTDEFRRRAEIHQSIESILQGRTSESCALPLSLALTMKGESSDEIRGIFQVVMKHAMMIAPRVNGTLIDTSGTGGDALKSFNISTVLQLSQRCRCQGSETWQ